MKCSAWGRCSSLSLKDDQEVSWVKSCSSLKCFFFFIKSLQPVCALYTRSSVSWGKEKKAAAVQCTAPVLFCYCSGFFLCMQVGLPPHPPPPFYLITLDNNIFYASSGFIRKPLNKRLDQVPFWNLHREVACVVVHACAEASAGN